MIGSRLHRDAEHLCWLGPRATAECLSEIGDLLDGHAVIETTLDRYRPLTRDMLRATGGDRPPARLSVLLGGKSGART